MDEEAAADAEAARFPEEQQNWSQGDRQEAEKNGRPTRGNAPRPALPVDAPGEEAGCEAHTFAFSTTLTSMGMGRERKGTTCVAEEEAEDDAWPLAEKAWGGERKK